MSISRKPIQMTLESVKSNLGNPAGDGVSGSQDEASSNGGKITTASAQERLLTSIHPQACESFPSLQAPVELPHPGK